MEPRIVQFMNIVDSIRERIIYRGKNPWIFHSKRKKLYIPLADCSNSRIMELRQVQKKPRTTNVVVRCLISHGESCEKHKSSARDSRSIHNPRFLFLSRERTSRNTSSTETPDNSRKLEQRDKVMLHGRCARDMAKFWNVMTKGWTCVTQVRRQLLFKFMLCVWYSTKNVIQNPWKIKHIDAKIWKTNGNEFYRNLNYKYFNNLNVPYVIFN